MLVKSKGWLSGRLFSILIGLVLFVGGLALPAFVFRQWLRGENIVQNYCRSHNSLPCEVNSAFGVLVIAFLLISGVYELSEVFKNLYFNDEIIIVANPIRDKKILFSEITKVSLSGTGEYATLTICLSHDRVSFRPNIQGEEFTRLLIQKIKKELPTIVIQGEPYHTDLQ